MVQHMQPELSTATAPDRPSAGGDDVEVEPVATLPGTASRIDQLPLEARVERLRRLTLELRVAGLQAELDRARQRQDRVIERYEQVLAEREQSGDDGSACDAPVFSWLTRS